mgnify:CR=1 FL=1
MPISVGDLRGTEAPVHPDRRRRERSNTMYDTASSHPTADASDPQLPADGGTEGN